MDTILKTSRVLFNIFLIYNAEKKIVLGEYGEPTLKNIPLSIFYKDKKDFNAFQIF